MKLVDLQRRDDLGLLLNGMGLHGTGVEIGVAYGENARNILDKWDDGEIILVDPYRKWEDAEYIDHTGRINFDGALKYARNLLIDYYARCHFAIMTSDEAYDVYKDRELDFAYIDGNHHYPQVAVDLEKWWTLVKSGGIFGGHDYYNLDEPGYKCDVKDAVDNFVEERGLKLHITEECSSWWILKQ